MLRVISVIAAACIVGLILGQTNTQQACWNHFVQTFSQCSTNNTINVQHLMYLTQNGTNGTAPPDLAAFKTQACGQQSTIFNCTLRIRNALLNHSACSQPEKITINSFFASVFQPYDIICAHPCRFAMIENFRSCYTKEKLDPDLFMSNMTSTGQQMLGTKIEEVNKFCAVKDPLVKCMKSEAMKCPESGLVMNNIRLDLDTMETTINVFCLHPKVYLASRLCFSSPSMEVRDCITRQNRRVYDLGMEAERTSMPRPDFLKRFCVLRFDALGCDLGAWKNHTLETCNPAVIGMKTELDCKLIPSDCKASLGQTFETVCGETEFKKTHRDNFGKGSGCEQLGRPTVLSAMMVLVCYLLHNWS